VITIAYQLFLVMAQKLPSSNGKRNPTGLLSGGESRLRQCHWVRIDHRRRHSPDWRLCFSRLRRSLEMKLAICEAELRVLYQISQMVGEILDLEQVLGDTLKVFTQSLAMERATVTLIEPETGNLKIQASHGLRPKERTRGIYRPDEGIIGRIFSTAQPFVVPDISREPLFLNKTQSRTVNKGSISFLGVPIVLRGQPIGVLSVDRLFGDEVSFEEDIRFLSIVATLFAQFINLNQQVQEREKSLKRQNLSLMAEVSEKYNHFFMIGKSPVMGRLQQLIEKVAPSRASVLLLGESGTGKTLVARIIHELSNRARSPFVKLNCAAVPENLLESELFGHEKGAFTGATSTKPGRFEEADGGTIFLDEIGELPPAIQAKLLRFIQEREFERLGSVHTRKVDVRVIAATNKDLTRAVTDGSFREDLYYRLNVFPVDVPPLRERKEDIPLLAGYFLEKAGKEYGRRLEFAPQCLDVLESYSWPGNVRELENLIERLAILAEGYVIEAEALTFLLANNHEVMDERVELPEMPVMNLRRMQEIERREILSALERNRWVQSWAARELGFTLRQLGYRIKKFGLEAVVSERRNRSA
jgi:Nif-specific regulatory protein